MPNKKKFKKLQLNALRKGKLSEQDYVKETLKHITAKSAQDNEDINFDFDEKRAGFEKLVDNDACDKKIRKSMIAEARKRKSMAEIEREKLKDAKKQKVETKKVEVNNGVKKVEIVPKSSMKNKYFFMAHPDKLKKHAANIETISQSTKFVIDEEKIRLNLELKVKKKAMKLNGSLESNEKVADDGNGKGKKRKGIWESGWCDSGDENVPDMSGKFGADSVGEVMDFSELGQKVKGKKIREKQPDGSFIEVFCPSTDSTKNVEVDGSVSGGEEAEGEIEGEENPELEEVVVEKSGVAKKKDLVTPEAKRNHMMDQLKSSRFRYLNELMYTQESGKSFKYFQEDSEAFNAYHEGFRNQVTKWPSNPLDRLINDIHKKSTSLIIADFGCGEAKLAQSVRNKVHSFDFIALNDLVTKCDMRKVPLNPGSCDIAVFCLSLMGTNIIEFLCEAHRILKPRGTLKIAEVVSRIEDRYVFIRKVESIGFKLSINKEEEEAAKKEPYFYFFDFVKNSLAVKGMPDIKLTPCLYKKR